VKNQQVQKLAVEIRGTAVLSTTVWSLFLKRTPRE